MNSKDKSLKLPFSLWSLISMQIFERLAYYLGRSLILIFVAASVAEGGLGLDDVAAAKMQSNLTAFSYLLPLIGAVIVDRFIGARYTTPVGMVIAGIGYWVGSMAHSVGMVYFMIFLVSAGLALFKEGAIVGRLIKDKRQMDSAFSWRYTLCNIGAFIGTLAVGVLYKDVFAHDGVYGFSPCFRIAAIAMWAGAIFFIFITIPQLGDVAKKPFKLEKTAEELEEEARAAAAKADDNEKTPLTAKEKKRIGAIGVASLFSIIFWIFWYVAYLPAYGYWADNMNWTFGSFTVPSTWFDAGNSMFCVLLGPVTGALWTTLAARPKGDMSIFKKTGFGISFLGIGYLFYAVLDMTRGDTKPSCLWLIVFLFLLTLGEMFFSPLGHSFISKYSPSRYLAVMMAVWGFATFIAAKSYGYVYGVLFGGNLQFHVACIVIAVIAFVSAIIMWAIEPRISKLVKD